MLRFLRLNSRKEHHHASDPPKGRLSAASGLDRFKSEVNARSPVASEWKVVWWPRGRAAAKRRKSRKAQASWHLRQMRDCLESKKSGLQFLIAAKRSRISAKRGLLAAIYGRESRLSMERSLELTSSHPCLFINAVGTQRPD